MKILVGVKRVIDYAAKVMPSPPLRFTPEFLFLLELCACFCAFCCPHPLGAEHLSFKVVTRKIFPRDMQVRVSANKSGVELNNVKMSVNPFCEIAMEEAVSTAVRCSPPGPPLSSLSNCPHTAPLYLPRHP